MQPLLYHSHGALDFSQIKTLIDFPTSSERTAPAQWLMASILQANPIFAI